MKSNRNQPVVAYMNPDLVISFAKLCIHRCISQSSMLTYLAAKEVDESEQGTKAAPMPARYGDHIRPDRRRDRGKVIVKREHHAPGRIPKPQGLRLRY